VVLVLQDQPKAGPCLIFKVDSLVCALPIGAVIETMRPLPIQRLEQAPVVVLGLAMIRGVPTPVIDTGRLLGVGRVVAAGRFITVAMGQRRVALAVTSVWGIRAVSGPSLQAMPPLFAQADADSVAAVGALDRELLMLLQAGRLVPEAVLAALSPSALSSPSPSPSPSPSRPDVAGGGAP
jgi:purine-binding chemotaxis protein CheW